MERFVVAPDSVRHVLMVSTDWLGDLLWTTPAIRLVRRVCPDARVSFLASRYAGPVLQGQPALDDLWLAETIGHRWLRRRHLGPVLRRLRGESIDLAIQFNHWSPNRRLLRRAGIQRIAGTREGMLVGRRRNPGEHLALERLHLVEDLFGVEAEDTRIRIFPSEADRERVETRLRSSGIEEPFVAVHVGTSLPLRRRSLLQLRRPPISHKAWLPERYAGVIRALIEDGYSAILTGSLLERPAVAETLRLTGGPPPSRALDVTGATSPLELAALLERASLYVGADTGVAHVAAAVDIPVVVLFGPTPPERCAPFNPSAPCRILEGQAPCRPCDGAVRRACTDNVCMGSIDEARVLTACRQLLAEGSIDRPARGGRAGIPQEA
jgi:ADP-heptose:LPS heptosyltransferase